MKTVPERAQDPDQGPNGPQGALPSLSEALGAPGPTPQDGPGQPQEPQDGAQDRAQRAQDRVQKAVGRAEGTT